MQPPTPPEKGVAKILLVDDHPANLLALRAVLSPLKPQLIEAASGEEALELTLLHDFAVIFMDVRMTGLSGIRTAALIGARKNRRRPPIILLTGLDSDEKEIVQAYAHGVVDYLRKPFDPTVLRAKASMFVELYLAQSEIERQSELLREKDRELLASTHRQQLHDILMQAPAAIALMRGETLAFEFANPVFERVTGRSIPLGAALADVLPELAGQPAVMDALHGVMATGEPFIRQEFLLQLDRARDGTLHDAFFDVTYGPIRDEQGVVTGVLTHAVEVTDQVLVRRKSEALARELEDSEARFRTLADTIPQLTWMADEHGHMFWFNRRWYDFTGFTPGTVDGWSWDQVHHPAHLADVVARWREALRDGEVFEMEFPLRRADGVYRWHLTRAVPVRDASGSIRRWFGTNTDVDDQRRARELQELLARASKELSASLQVGETLTQVAQLAVPTLASFCAFDLLDARGVLQRVAAHATPDCAPLVELRRRRADPSELGRGVQQVVQSGKRLWVPAISHDMVTSFADDERHLGVLTSLALRSYLVVPLRVRERVVGALSLVVADDARELGEPELRVVDELASRTALAIDNARLFDEVHDLNARLEQRVQERTAELQEANRELESFTYSVSHDLRAPLRHITGFAQLLERRLGPAVDEPSRGFLRTISEAAQQGGKLVDDLLAFSRLGRAAMKLGFVDLSALLTDLQRDLAPEMEGRTVTWKVGPLPPVRADVSLLRLALRNLLSNALKYSRPRAETVIDVSAEERPGETEIVIRDNGVGFDMQYVDKLFGVFQRLHTADEFEGTGIGLANVRRIIARHGGRTWAEGEVGGGATFHLTLPREPTAPATGDLEVQAAG